MSRRCGYCRLEGHMSSKCEIRLGQIDNILRHVGAERMELVNLLADNGIGLGTIMRLKLWDGREREYVITSFEGIMRDSLIDWRIHKYRKSVHSTMRGWSGKNHSKVTISDDYQRLGFKESILVPCRPLDDMSDSSYASFSVCRLNVKPNWSRGRNPMYHETQPEILCPSNDTDISEKDILNPVHLHDRLHGEGRYKTFTPILPT